MTTSDTNSPTTSRAWPVTAATSLMLAVMPLDATAQMYRQVSAGEPSAETHSYLLPSAQPYLLPSDTSIPLSPSEDTREAKVSVRNDAARTELDAVRDLRDGWDGRRAPAPSEFAFVTAGRIIAVAEVVGVELARVAADVEGGLVLYAFANGAARSRRVGFVIANDDKESLVVFKTNRGAPEPDVEMVALKDLDIRQALVDALRFLS